MLIAIYDMHGPTITCAKLSILLLYFQLFKVYNSLRILIHTGIWTTVLLHITATVAGMILCTAPNVEAYTKCNRRSEVIALVTSCVNVVSDFYILLIPILAVWRLKISKQRKAGVLAVFSTGIL